MGRQGRTTQQAHPLAPAVPGASPGAPQASTRQHPGRVPLSTDSEHIPARWFWSLWEAALPGQAGTKAAAARPCPRSEASLQPSRKVRERTLPPPSHVGEPRDAPDPGRGDGSDHAQRCAGETASSPSSGQPRCPRLWAGMRVARRTKAVGRSEARHGTGARWRLRAPSRGQLEGGRGARSASGIALLLALLQEGRGAELLLLLGRRLARRPVTARVPGRRGLSCGRWACVWGALCRGPGGSWGVLDFLFLLFHRHC